MPPDRWWGCRARGSRGWRTDTPLHHAVRRRGGGRGVAERRFREPVATTQAHTPRQSALHERDIVGVSPLLRQAGERNRTSRTGSSERRGDAELGQSPSLPFGIRTSCPRRRCRCAPAQQGGRPWRAARSRRWRAGGARSRLAWRPWPTSTRSQRPLLSTTTLLWCALRAGRRRPRRRRRSRSRAAPACLRPRSPPPPPPPHQPPPTPTHTPLPRAGAQRRCGRRAAGGAAAPRLLGAGPRLPDEPQVLPPAHGAGVPPATHRGAHPAWR